MMAVADEKKEKIGAAWAEEEAAVAVADEQEAWASIATMEGPITGVVVGGLAGTEWI
jgi:hypothetical protein